MGTRSKKQKVKLPPGPITVSQARTWATAKVGPLTLPPDLARASVERIGREQKRLAARYMAEREHRIKVYEAAYKALKTHGVRGEPKAVGLPPLRIVAEGDSWFDYPLSDGGIIPRLEKRLGVEILNLAEAGDEVRFMLGVKQRKLLEKALKKPEPFDLLLFSGGGNDVVDNPMCLWIKQWQPGQPPLDATRFGAILSVIRAGYEDLIEIRNRVNPNTWIFIHAYDFPIPDGRGVCFKGPWLKPSLDYRGVPSLNDRIAVARTMLEEFARMLLSIESAPNRVKFVRTQGTLRASQWANELHPTDEGFDAMTDLFHQAIKAQFPGRVM